MPRNYKQFFAICKKHGFDYKEKIAEFTEGRTDSLRALKDEEYMEMMLRLKSLNAPFRQHFTPKPGDKQRKKIIAIAREMRWDVPSPVLSSKKENNTIMMQHIDEFLLTRTKYKKRLSDLSVDELNKVCATFEKDIKASFLRNLNP